MSQGPNIFDYLNYRDYLRDYLDFLQSRDSKFSQRWFAKKAGWKSPQLLSMILSGQRKLSPTNAQLLSLAIDHSEREEAYFQLIIELTHMENQEDQDKLLSKLKAEFQTGIFSHIDGQGAEMLSQWFIPALREYIDLKSLSQAPSVMAQALEISREDVERGLIVLSKHGFISQDSQGRWVKSTPSVRADDYIAPIVMAQFHLQMIQKSLKAMALPREQRHFEALTLSLKASQVEGLREKIKSFIREVDMEAENFPRRDQLFQLNIQFFSLLSGTLNDTQKDASL